LETIDYGVEEVINFPIWWNNNLNLCEFHTRCSKSLDFLRCRQFHALTKRHRNIIREFPLPEMPIANSRAISRPKEVVQPDCCEEKSDWPLLNGIIGKEICDEQHSFKNWLWRRLRNWSGTLTQSDKRPILIEQFKWRMWGRIAVDSFARVYDSDIDSRQHERGFWSQPRAISQNWTGERKIGGATPLIFCDTDQIGLSAKGSRNDCLIQRRAPDSLTFSTDNWEIRAEWVPWNVVHRFLTEQNWKSKDWPSNWQTETGRSPFFSKMTAGWMCGLGF
jgi:hypothetical protein